MTAESREPSAAVVENGGGAGGVSATVPADAAPARSIDEDFTAFSASARTLELAEADGENGGSSRSLFTAQQGLSSRSLGTARQNGSSRSFATARHELSDRSLGTARQEPRAEKSDTATDGADAASATASSATDRLIGEVERVGNDRGEGAPASTEADGAAGADAEEKKKRYATPKDFELLKVIGMGAFGKVLQVRNRASGDVLAMKVISKRLLRRKTSYVENVQAERDILTKCNHPFVVTMHCSFQTKEKLFIIMDFLAGGELFLRLGREGHFLERTAAFYIAEIVLALEHLHGRGVLHRDLKPENILLSSDGHLCVTDFGLAKDFSTEDGWGDDDGGGGRARTVCGTQEYMAPEMVARKGYGRAADFWSLGCISYEMLAGRPPFESRKGSKDLFQKIMNQRVKMPDGASASACRLLKGLLNRNAQARLGAARGDMFNVGGIAGLKQMDFFNGLDWVKLEHKEIDPPETLDVDHDEDLRHFHDEFTNMTLPRSVTEMNKPHFQPRRCDSDVFRGFSFVHDEFTLPERPDHEHENYWNSVDSDGQSMSECASSAFGDDVGEGIPAAEKTPVTEKKKRPPRKKKKKKAPLEVTQEKKEEVNLAPVKEQQKEDDKVDSPKNTTKQEPEDSPVAENQKKRNDIERSNAGNKPAAQSPMPKATVQSSPPVRGNVKPMSNPPAKKTSEKWETMKGAKTPPANRDLSSNTSRQPVPQAKPASSLGWQQPVSPALSGGVSTARAPPPPPGNQNAYKPASGSWAAKMTQNSSAVGHRSHLSRDAHVNGSPGAQIAVTNKSDWRCHSMPSPGKNSPRKTAPPQAGGAWPSLGNIPAPPISSGGSESKPDLMQRKAPQGSWAVKTSMNHRQPAVQRAVKR